MFAQVMYIHIGIFVFPTAVHQERLIGMLGTKKKRERRKISIQLAVITEKERIKVFCF